VRLKMLLVTVFAAGLGASYALADDGHGNGNKGEGDHGHGSKCTQVHVRGTIAPQTLTVTLTDQARKLNLAPGSQVVLQLGAAGQTVSVNAEACSTTSGSTTQLLVKSAELRARTPKTTTTAPVTTTAAQVTTTAPGTTTSGH
jgi:TOBE domain-containing protein